MNEQNAGGFTLPGEAGYEELSLALAARWGADAIRDCDGTELSKRLLSAGLAIYSTLCVIRDHNVWIEAHPHARQQCILSTASRVMTADPLCLPLMEGFLGEQFEVNAAPDALAYWQVYDRTANRELPRDQWTYDASTGEAVIHGVLWHAYTVSFFAYRVWEEISMYNHITNGWNKEHLAQVDPIHPEARQYLRQWLTDWCGAHPATSVVRFTSLFYNFAWIWGGDPRNRYLFTDWASYDFTVSPAALRLFEAAYGYALAAEDFVNKGFYRATHSVPDAKKRDWMRFMQGFVLGFGRELVDIVHAHGKRAFVFYDDSWVGLEPYGDRFVEFGFDGIIKCVFSGFEARMCADVPVATRELRLHPYLFPVGLNRAPTFMRGGDPAGDARIYWRNVRRALLRQPVDRIGLGGYLHLIESFPSFVDTMEELAAEFRAIKALHAQGPPQCLPPRVAVLHAWGALRSWTLSGHFHETDAHDLIHLLESLSGLPVEVRFVDFDDLLRGALQGVDVLLCAGRKGTAWSGGELWADPAVVETVTAWVHEGGGFIGVNEASALEGYATNLRMAQVLGVDIDAGNRSGHGNWRHEVRCPDCARVADAELPGKSAVFLTDGKAEVWMERKGAPALTCNTFGKGRGLYLSGYRHSLPNARLLLLLLHAAAGLRLDEELTPDDPYVECAWYPASRGLALINNDGRRRQGKVWAGGQEVPFVLAPYELQIRTLRAIQK